MTAIAAPLVSEATSVPSCSGELACSTDFSLPTLAVLTVHARPTLPANSSQVTNFERSTATSVRDLSNYFVPANNGILRKGAPVTVNEVLVTLAQTTIQDIHLNTMGGPLAWGKLPWRECRFCRLSCPARKLVVRWNAGKGRWRWRREVEEWGVEKGEEGGE